MNLQVVEHRLRDGTIFAYCHSCSYHKQDFFLVIGMESYEFSDYPKVFSQSSCDLGGNSLLFKLIFFLYWRISQYQRNKIWSQTPKLYAGTIQNLSATPVSNSSVFYYGKIIIPVFKERAYPAGFFGILYFYLTYIRSL